MIGQARQRMDMSSTPSNRVNKHKQWGKDSTRRDLESFPHTCALFQVLSSRNTGEKRRATT